MSGHRPGFAPIIVYDAVVYRLSGGRLIDINSINHEGDIDDGGDTGTFAILHVAMLMIIIGVKRSKCGDREHASAQWRKWQIIVRKSRRHDQSDFMAHRARPPAQGVAIEAYSSPIARS